MGSKAFFVGLYFTERGLTRGGGGGLDRMFTLEALICVKSEIAFYVIVSV